MIRLRTASATLVLVAVLAGTGSHASVGRSVTYTFEDCAEGWTVAESDDNPSGGTWERADAAHPKRPGAVAFRIGPPYPIGNGTGDPPLIGADVYEATLTSKMHSFGAGTAAISYSANFDLDEGGDYLILEYSRGKRWVTIDRVTGLSGSFGDRVATFKATRKPVRLRFRLVSDALRSGTTGVGGFVAVDHLTVTAGRPAGSACR